MTDFSQSPLRGKRIVITRAVHQAEEVAVLLRERGAQPLLYPCIAITPPDDTTLLDAALKAVEDGEFDWLVLTSTNTVYAVDDRMKALGLNKAALASLRTAAIGVTTARAAKDCLQLNVDMLPDDAQSSALAKALDPIAGARIFLPHADIAPPDLAQALTEKGAEVTDVIAYRTVIGTGGVDLPRLLTAHQVDAITFASPSAVRNFMWRLIEEGGSTPDLAGVVLACIGVTTSQAAYNCGLQVSVVPPVSDMPHMVQSLEDFFA